MDGWGFWEWLTYGCIAVAALMLALDAAVKQSPGLNARFGAILAGRAWAFTPFTLILVSAIVIAIRHLSPTHEVQKGEGGEVQAISSPSSASSPSSTKNPVLKKFHIEAVEAVRLPADLTELSNDDLRSLAYTASTQEGELSLRYYAALEQAKWDDSGNNLRSPESLAVIQLSLDTEFNRLFRAKFKDVLLKLHSELLRRLKSPSINDLSLGDGLISPAQADSVSYRLTDLAKGLP